MTLFTRHIVNDFDVVFVHNFLHCLTADILSPGMSSSFESSKVIESLGFVVESSLIFIHPHRARIAMLSSIPAAPPPTTTTLVSQLFALVLSWLNLGKHHG